MSGHHGAGELRTGERPALITPDAVGLDLQIATVGSRAVAFLLDLLLVGTAFVLLLLAGAALPLGTWLPDWLGVAVVFLLVFALLFGYPIAFETLRRGRTPGKAALGLRVVTVEGAPVAFRHASIRAVFAVIELYGLVGAPALVAALVTPRAQRLGDLTAGTMVMRERRATAEPRAERYEPPPGLEWYVAQLDVSGLRPPDYATIRETLRRAPDLPETARTEVTEGLARSLVGRVQPAPPGGVAAETFLRALAAAVQRTRPSAPGPVAPRTAAGPSAPQPDGTVPQPRATPPPRPSGDGFVPPA
jgi:uncharacterized RDD family membrane protein YckC